MKSKLFNNYQLYTVLHPEDNTPAFSHAHSSAIRVMKPDKKCKRSTREYLDDGCIPDKTENSDVVADISIEDLLVQGLEAGLPCLQHLQGMMGAKRVGRACAKSTTLCKQPRSWDDIKRLVTSPETSDGFHSTVEASPTSTDALIAISKQVDSTKVAKRLFYELAALYHKHQPDLRRGQCIFNLMTHVHPTMASKYAGGPIDPFHDNSKIRVFVDTCYKEAKKKKGAK
jgi:hypothetical protein